MNFCNNCYKNPIFLNKLTIMAECFFQKKFNNMNTMTMELGGKTINIGWKSTIILSFIPVQLNSWEFISQLFSFVTPIKF